MVGGRRARTAGAEGGDHGLGGFVLDRGAVPTLGSAADSSRRARWLGQHDLSCRRHDVDEAPESRDVRASDQGASLVACPRSASARADPEAHREGKAGLWLPEPWSVYGWLEGDPVATSPAAIATGLLMISLRFSPTRQAPTVDGPRAGAHSFNRGGPVTSWDEQTRSNIERLAEEVDADGALKFWEAATTSPGSARTCGSTVTSPGRTFFFTTTGSAGDRLGAAVGDQRDLTVAWTTFDGTARRRFVQAMEYDAGTWVRAAGWASGRRSTRSPNGRPAIPPAPALSSDGSARARGHRRSHHRLSPQRMTAAGFDVFPHGGSTRRLG